MLTQCGPMCDVCGHYILSGDINPFSMKGIDGTLLCHDDCKVTFLKAKEAGSFRLLPDGPIRKAFEDAEAAL